MNAITQLPKASVSQKKEISLVWIIPIVALVIGAGMVFNAFTQKGPVAVIRFESAESLEAGKTRVKYKDVDVGKVSDVSLSENFQGVRITVDLAREADGYLTDQTRFWVVRPRLSGSTVSGLGTLLSGAYIAIEPGSEGVQMSEFIGLEEPPLVTRDSKGKLFTLKAGKLDSLDYGSPVYYRGVKVGQVTGYGLEEGGQGVDVQVFINAPHDKMVVGSSKFWSASGLDMDLGTDGLKINTESLMSILLGGIVLSNPDTATPGVPAAAGTVFSLYESREKSMARQFTRKEAYLLKFSQSVRGLDIGAPVEFRGFVVGRVTDIGIEFDREKKQVLVSVRIEIEDGWLEQMMAGKGRKDEDITLDVLVAQGMRGQVRTGNLLTGKLYVALDFFETTSLAMAIDHGDILEIPTLPTPIEALTTSLYAIMGKLQKLPIEKIAIGIEEAVRSIKTAGDAVTALAASGEIAGALKKLNQVMSSAQTLAEGLASELPPAVGQAKQTLEGVNTVLSRDAAVVVELHRTMEELAGAAKAVRTLAEELERHPESLIMGKEKE